MTNLEYLRTLDFEEMSGILCESSCSYCYEYYKLNRDRKGTGCSGKCKEGVVTWLKSKWKE